MRPAVFVDNSALIAVYLDTDARHREALELFEGLRRRSAWLLTSTDVFGETVTLLRRWGGYAVARAAGNALRQSREIELVPVDDADRDAAWSLFLHARIPKLSMTDATSAAIMRRLGLREVLTFDGDFRSLGFQVLPSLRPLLKPRRM